MSGFRVREEMFNEKKRRKYTREFKEEAVKLITEQGDQISEAARNLGGNEKCWVA